MERIGEPFCKGLPVVRAAIFAHVLMPPPPHVKDQFGWLDEDLNSCNTPVCSSWASDHVG